FFIPIPRPTSSSPLSSPPLFRSRPDSRRWQWAESAAAIPGDGHPSAYALPRVRGHGGAVRLRAGRAHHALSRREVDPHHPPLDQDRKSTRLNSSHLVISYAVFCL